MNLSPHFTLAELTVSAIAARNGLRNEPSPQDIEQLRRLCVAILEPLRLAVGGPIIVLSGYRSLKVNALAGGSRTSHHMEGRAADIIVPGWTPLAVCRRIQAMGLPFEQCIHEFGEWCHVSVALTTDAPKRQTMTATHTGSRVAYVPGLVAVSA